MNQKYASFNDDAYNFFEKEGYAIVKLDIETRILKKARTEIQKIAKFEENSGDSCFYENRNKEEGISYVKKNYSEYGIF